MKYKILNTLVKQFFTGNQIIVEIRKRDNGINLKLACDLNEEEYYEKPFEKNHEKSYMLENTLESNHTLNLPFNLNKNIEDIISSLKIETENKKITEIVKNMIKENIDPSLISKITYLTIDEIENLK